MRLKFRKKISEDAPVNNVGGGNIAGMGVGPKGEPGVPKNKQAREKSPILFPKMMKRTVPSLVKEDMEHFAGSVIFEVSPSTFHCARMEKRKGKHWRTYLEEDECFQQIREYLKANPKKGVILQNERTGEMMYARYPKKGR